MNYSQIPVKLIELESVDSTNNYIAKKVLTGDLIPGTVVLAEKQTEARGQRGTKWQSLAGLNSTSSVFLTWKDIKVREQFKISMLVAIGVCRFLRNFNIEAEIKWPNDIYVQTKKIAGILIENQIKGDYISSSVTGIGLNVNQEVFEEGLSATSIIIETGKKENVRLFTMQLYQEIGRTIEQYHQYPFEWIERTYSGFLKGFDEAVTAIWIQKQEEIKIQITAILPDGRIKALVNETDYKLFDLKELKFIF